MNVLWIQDYLRPDGGAEQSNKAVVHVGESLGFDIVGMSPRNFNSELFRDCDLVVINNFHYFSPLQKEAVFYALLEGRVPFVIYSHDYRDLKRKDFMRPLFENARLNIFISPRHLEEHRKIFGVNGVAIPLCIETNGFKPDPRVLRNKNTALVVTPRKQGQECRQFIEAHRNEWKFAALGQRFSGCQNTLIRHRLQDMPTLYSAFETVVHLPESPWAGERVIFEATLCGCAIVANDNVGHMSWGWDLADTTALTERLEQAPFTFWKTIEDALWS